MRKSFVRKSLIAATALAGAGAAALPAAPANAAAGSVQLSSTTVTLSPTSHVYLTVNADFGACMEEGLIEVKAASGTGFDYKDFGRDDDGKVSVKFPFAADDSTGKWYVSISGATCDYASTIEQDDIATFSVFRPTRIVKLDAAPEPIKKGKKLTVSGYLQRMDPYGGSAGGPAYVVARGVKVAIQFKAKGTGTWVSGGTATSASSGRFAKTFTAAKDGYWRAVFPGSGTYAASTGTPDYVDVR